jgi:hypothetical protein
LLLNQVSTLAVAARRERTARLPPGKSVPNVSRTSEERHRSQRCSFLPKLPCEANVSARDVNIEAVGNDCHAN